MSAVAPLNFCRDLLKYRERIAGLEKDYQFNQTDANEALTKNHINAIEFAAMAARASQKFALPDGGVLFEDTSLRGIDENMPLRLPYPKIALEYLATRDHTPEIGALCRRRIVFASEIDDSIVVFPVVKYDGTERWIPMGFCKIPINNYCNKLQNGLVQLNVELPHDYLNENEYKHIFTRKDYFDEISTLLFFLNALQCSNVHIKKEPARKPCKKTKNALPYDDYHTLVIETKRPQQGESHGTLAGARRAMREHLRRGHIVRPEGRRPYWRNATVVNAGKAESKISKDYAVRAEA